MLKKLKKILKFVVIGTLWTYVYVSVAHFLMLKIWNFNLFAPEHWQVISSYWNHGGKIKSAKDYMFSVTLIALVPLWFWGFRRLYKTEFAKIILFPIIYYNKRQIEKASKSIPRTVLKNIGINQKIDINEMIKERLAAEAPEAKEDVNIRQSIQEKISNVKK